MKTLLPLASLALFLSSAAAREWTNVAGKKIEADLIEVKGTPGAEIVVLQMAGGQKYNLTLNQLSAADQAFIKEQSAAKPTATSEPKAPSKFKEMLDGKLVALTGKRVGKYEMAEEPEHYAFYFSAHWCPPCRAFTPKLVSFYNEQPGKKKQFEIIFVSSDNDENQMEDYIKGDAMPWPAIAYRSVDRMKEIKAYAGKGIPCLVLVDREGKVLSHSYEGETYVGPTKVMNDIPKMTAAK
jgi:thiol-disulfide isomerase/thioredoxin